MAQVNDISKMDEYEIVELFRKTMKEYVDTFNEYCSILVLYLETLQLKYPDIRYEIGKTELSSAKIGKSLTVYEFPFKLPNEYYEDGNYI